MISYLISLPLSHPLPQESSTFFIQSKSRWLTRVSRHVLWIQVGSVCYTFRSPLLFPQHQVNVYLCSVAKLYLTHCDPMDCDTPGLPVPSPSPGVCPSSYPLNWRCHPTISSSVTLFSFCLQSFPTSGSFQRVGCSHQVAISFNFSISPSNEYLGLNSIRIEWFDLLIFEGTLKSLLQHHSLKASILWCSDLLMVQLWHLYMTTGKITALTMQTFVSKVMNLFLIHYPGLSWLFCQEASIF